jgi:hypothetical protein
VHFWYLFEIRAFIHFIPVHLLHPRRKKKGDVERNEPFAPQHPSSVSAGMNGDEKEYLNFPVV